MCQLKRDGNIFKEIFSHPFLTPNEKILLNRITSLAHNTPDFACYASNKNLAEFMGLSTKTIRNMISIFVRDHFLFTKPKKKQNTLRIPNEKRILDRATPRNEYSSPKFEDTSVLGLGKPNSPDIQDDNVPDLRTERPGYQDSNTFQPSMNTVLTTPLKKVKESIKTVSPPVTFTGRIMPSSVHDDTKQKKPTESKKQDQEYLDWCELYEYVMCVLLRLDPKTRKLPEHKKISGTVAARLKQLSKGITSGNLKTSSDSPIIYPFPAILWTFKDIEPSLRKKFFENGEFHSNPSKKFTYALAAAAQNIDYQLKQYNDWTENRKGIDLWKVIAPPLEKRCKLYDEIMTECTDIDEATEKIKKFKFLNEDVLKQIIKGFGKGSKEYNNYMEDYVTKENIPKRLKDIKSGKAKALKDLEVKREEIYKLDMESREALDKLGREIGRFNIQYKRESELHAQNCEKRREQICKWKREIEGSYP